MSAPRSGPSGSEVSRRGVLRGAALGGVAVPLLAACGNEADTSGQQPTGAGGADSGPADPSSNGGGGGGQELATTSDVPVGGGEILSDDKIVLTQPTKGDFKAFSAVCTHQQCLVSTISDGKILCTCHGSEYSIKDGSVLGGPAPQPLAAVPIAVEGDRIVEA